jgi:sensor histidine kinase YesM
MKEPFVVSIPNLPGKCEVFIDGVCVFSNHKIPGTNYTTLIESYAIPFDPKDATDDDYEIIIEVTCNYSSGLTSAPVLSSYETYHSKEIGTLAQRYFYIGITMFFAISALVLAIINKHKRNANKFWLFVLCITFAFRMLITNEGYMVSHSLFGDIDYEIMTSVVYVSTYILKLSMLMHVIDIVDIKIHQGFIVAIAGLFLVCAFVPYVLYDYIYFATSYIWLQSVTYILDVFIIYKIAKAVIDKRKMSLLYLIAYCITTGAIMIDNFYINGYVSKNITFIMPMACVSFIAIMVLIHMFDTVEMYKQAKRSAELQKELGDMNMTLMLSQIQPHFMYNALNTIKYLTKKDPKAAENAIVRFSSYLRANMDSLTQKEPIPFTKEMDHVENYVAIERLRFGDRLNVEYDIQYSNFNIPSLTIQPIAENAIKHGINQRVDGGTLKISSYEKDDKIFVVVEDNGVGFDVNEVKNDGRSHIGMNNIKNRLKEMLDAEVTVVSALNEGTCVTIKIPREEKTK